MVKQQWARLFINEGLTFVDFSEGSIAQSLDDFESLLKNFHAIVEYLIVKHLYAFRLKGGLIVSFESLLFSTSREVIVIIAIKLVS